MSHMGIQVQLRSLISNAMSDLTSEVIWRLQWPLKPPFLRSGETESRASTSRPSHDTLPPPSSNKLANLPDSFRPFPRNPSDGAPSDRCSGCSQGSSRALLRR